jgi:hypothetical protein
MGKYPTQRRALFLAVLLAAGGCAGNGGLPATGTGGGGGGGGGGDGSTVSFASIQQEIFDNDCTSSACHSSATRAGGMSLEAGEAYDNLVNVMPDNPVAAAAGLMRVTPDHPERSFLIDKLTDQLSAGEGSPMPLGGIPLGSEQIDMIRTWIANGAMPDATNG